MRNGFTMLAGTALAATTLIISSAAASETPAYAPVPDWVEERPLPAIDPAAEPSDFTFLLADRQTRFHDGMVESYSAYAYRINNASLLSQFGNLSSSWNPEKGDFTVHKVMLIRPDERVDLIAGGQRFTVLRRETNLEKLSLDGILTATMQLEGMKVGDILLFESTTSYRDTTLGGHVNDTEGLLPDKLDVKSAGLRFLWAPDVAMKWQAPDAADARIGKSGEMVELTIASPAIEERDTPNNAPTRYRLGPIVELTSFPDWQTVSRTAFEPYAERAEIAPGSALAGVVAGIAAEHADPDDRIAAALRVVQDDVRYLFKGMENGNYTPQTPETTWALRYGDCKAKSLLLATMLRELGVRADIMLVNASSGDALPDRLPGFSAFDHVIVRAQSGEREYWLDGTRVGDRQDDLADTPGFAWALPLSATGSGLVPIPVRPLARRTSDVALTYDSRAGVNLPALFDVTITWRTSTNDDLKTSKGTLTDKEYKTAIDARIDKLVSNTGIYDRAISFDEDADTTTLSARGVTWLDWDRVDGRYERAFNSAVGSARLNANRAKAEWRDIGYAIGSLTHNRYATRMLLPANETGFVMAGRSDIDEDVAGVQYHQTASFADGTFDAFETWRTFRREIPASELPVERRKVAAIKGDPLRIEAPEGYPGVHVEAMLAARDKRLGPVLEALTKAIESAPEDEMAPLRSRAYVYEVTQQYDLAVADLDAVLATDPTADNYLWRARMYAPGDVAKAEADIERARAIEPDSEGALKQLVQLRLDGEDYDGALAAIDDGEGLGLDRKFVASLRAIVLAAADRDADALTALAAAGRAAQSAPDVLEARCHIAAFYQVGEDEALHACTRSIQFNSAPAQSLLDRAIAYARLGRDEEAMADIDLALEIDPDFADAWFMRAVVAKGPEAKRDLTYAGYIDRDIAADYVKVGIVP